jgi:hypothetical protein
MAAALAVSPALAAGAQPRQPAAGPARIASVSAAAAVRAAQVISLNRLHLVSGVVLDLRRHALSGVCVLAADLDGLVRVARTSATGRYETSVPRTGTYSVTYRECQPGKAAAPVQAAGVVVPRDGRIIRLRGGSGHLALDVTGPGRPDVGGLTGRVTNPAGKPLAAICVWVVGKGFAVGIPSTRSGTYKFGANEFFPGRYLVLFTSNCGTGVNPFVPIGPGPWAPEWYKGKFAQAKATKVRLRAHKVTRGINAVMRRAGDVSGTLSGSDHRRLTGACAVLTDSSGREFGQAVTNARGTYTITGLDSGSYRLVGVAACTGGVSDYAPTWYPHGASIKQARVIKVRRGHRTTGINVVLQKLGTVTGLVRRGGKAGKPLGGICVTVFSTNLEDFGSATSRKNGTYVVEGLPAGTYEVQASASGCGNDGNYAPAQYPRAVHVADAATTSGINLYLQPGGTLTGIVADAATAKPLAGICVSDGNGDFAATAKNGSYKIDQLPAERTTVAFNGGCGNAGSYAPQYYDDQVAQEAAQQVTVTAGHVTGGINAAMLPGATIAGRVTNSAGRPVPGVCLAFVPGYQTGQGLSLGGDTTTNAAGSYVAANLAPGDYAVAFFSGCLMPSNAAVVQWFKGQPALATAGLVDATAGAEVSGIDAVAGRGGAIAGTVTSAAGQPVEFDCVTAISRRTGQPSGFQSQSGLGTYTVSGLAPGNYTVAAADCQSDDNLAPSVYRRAVTVRAGVTTTNVALTLPPGGAVAGRIVRASNGRPVRGACVKATPVSGAAANLGFENIGLTSGSGAYKIAGLRTGTYRIAIYPGCAVPAVDLQAVTLPHAVRVTQGKVKAGVNASLHVGGSIAGLVTGPGAATVPGACAEAFKIPGGLAGASATDAHGAFVVTGLTPGRYKVEFGDPSCSDGPPGLGTQWYDRAAGSGSATVITVKAGQAASAIDGVLPADGTITGSVTGPSAAPLAGVCVSAVPAARGEPTVFTVSAGGAYTLADLLPGRYRVEFQAGCGRAGVTTQWWQDAGSSVTAKIITVGPGDTISGVDAVLANT